MVKVTLVSSLLELERGRVVSVEEPEGDDVPQLANILNTSPTIIIILSAFFILLLLSYLTTVYSVAIDSYFVQQFPAER